MATEYSVYNVRRTNYILFQSKIDCTDSIALTRFLFFPPHLHSGYFVSGVLFITKRLLQTKTVRLYIIIKMSTVQALTLTNKLKLITNYNLKGNCSIKILRLTKNSRTVPTLSCQYFTILLYLNNYLSIRKRRTHFKNKK